MSDIPVFRLHGAGDTEVEERIQPRLALRGWSALTRTEMETILQELHNRDWIGDSSQEVLIAVYHLNRSFLRELPGKRLHKIKPVRDGYGNNDDELCEAAYEDFREIILKCENEDIVLRLLSKLAEAQIDGWRYKAAAEEQDATLRQKYVQEAFEKFDQLASALNYLFRQFAVNMQVTRSGFIPVQDRKIAEEIYAPTLAALSDPKYVRVSDDLAKMFADYRAGDFGEVITKAHSSVQRFLQICVGDEGKNGKGELRELFATAKARGLTSSTRFGEPLIKVLEGFFPSERATKSTAKPTLTEATPRDAMLMMDLAMVFIQHCLAA